MNDADFKATMQNLFITHYRAGDGYASKWYDVEDAPIGERKIWRNFTVTAPA